MDVSIGHVVPNIEYEPREAYFLQRPKFANYLPDELLLEVLSYIPTGRDSQTPLAAFCLVSRQWYDVAVQRLYEAPYLAGRTYDLFVRTICPSVNTHIKKSELAGLVQSLDLSHIVHHGNKATTARLLNRTKPSLRKFIAPQASFAINCWASLSKCTKLNVLDLSLVSECISYQSLNQTVRQLPELTELYLPRCSSNYEGGMALSMNMKWPPKMKHLQLSGSVHGKFMWDMLRQPENFPRTMSSVTISHCPGLDHKDIRSFLQNVSNTLTHVELRDIPAVSQGRLNGVLEWVPGLKSLIIAMDYIDVGFGHMPLNFNPSRWMDSKPLESFTLVTSGQRDVDPNRSFAAVDLFTLIDERFLGRLRYINIAQSTGWASKDEAAEVDALELLLHELDKENWDERRWHYAPFLEQYENISWGLFMQSGKGRDMRPRLRMLKDQ